MPAVDRWDQRRAKKTGRGFVHRGQNRCMECGADPYPRTFFCSDECSEAQRARNTAALSRPERKPRA